MSWTPALTSGERHQTGNSVLLWQNKMIVVRANAALNLRWPRSVNDGKIMNTAPHLINQTHQQAVMCWRLLKNKKNKMYFSSSYSRRAHWLLMICWGRISPSVRHEGWIKNLALFGSRYDAKYGWAFFHFSLFDDKNRKLALALRAALFELVCILFYQKHPHRGGPSELSKLHRGDLFSAEINLGQFSCECNFFIFFYRSVISEGQKAWINTN